MGKAPISDLVKKMFRDGKGQELVELGRRGGGEIEWRGKTYKVQPLREGLQNKRENN